MIKVNLESKSIQKKIRTNHSFGLEWIPSVVNLFKAEILKNKQIHQFNFDSIGINPKIMKTNHSNSFCLCSFAVYSLIPESLKIKKIKFSFKSVSIHVHYIITNQSKSIGFVFVRLMMGPNSPLY